MSVRTPNPLDTVPDEHGEISSSVSRGPRSEAVLTVLRGPNAGAMFTVKQQAVVIGRSPDVAVPILDDTLSRQHARILRVGGVFAVEDLGSTNGTVVDGTRVEGTLALEDGARIHLGSKVVLHFRLHDEVELQTVEQTQALALRDPLTGLFNRRHLQERFQAEVAFAQRHRTPLSLLLMDVDHFKRINDEHGHPAGDALLRAFADELRGLTREEDIVARYGGEEFAVVARGISLVRTEALAQRIRQATEDHVLDVEGVSLAFTVSIGVAHTDGDPEHTTQYLFGAADRALYSAKDAGRNSVSIAPGRQ